MLQYFNPIIIFTCACLEKWNQNTNLILTMQHTLIPVGIANSLPTFCMLSFFVLFNDELNKYLTCNLKASSSFLIGLDLIDAFVVCKPVVILFSTSRTIICIYDCTFANRKDRRKIRFFFKLSLCVKATLQYHVASQKRLQSGKTEPRCR